MAKRTTEVVRQDPADLVGTEETDLQFAQTVGTTVIAFLKRAAVFFKQADELQAEALKQLEIAQTLKQPENELLDLALQKGIAHNNNLKRRVEDHWSITTVVSKLHRRLTGRRSVATDAIERTLKIRNDLHNAYVDAERRRAQAEADRLQAIEDARARKERDDEVARLEQQALDSEAGSAELSAREQTFVSRFLIHNSQLRAAKEAGYADPERQALRLIQSTKIIGEIERRKTAAAVLQQAEALKQAPVETRRVAVTPNIGRVAGLSSRTTKSAKIISAETFLEAALSPELRERYDIPADVLKIDLVKLNEYARDLPASRFNSWPGVEVESNTKGVNR